MLPKLGCPWGKGFQIYPTISILVFWKKAAKCFALRRRLGGSTRWKCRRSGFLFPTSDILVSFFTLDSRTRTENDCRRNHVHSQLKNLALVHAITYTSNNRLYKTCISNSCEGTHTALEMEEFTSTARGRKSVPSVLTKMCTTCSPAFFRKAKVLLSCFSSCENCEPRDCHGGSGARYFTVARFCFNIVDQQERMGLHSNF